MQLHEITRTSSRQDAKRVGRGGKRGKTSGKGHKGQKARTGNSTRPNVRDTIKKIPKLRGQGKNRGRTVNSGDLKPFGVNLSTIELHFNNGDTVSPVTLFEKRLIPSKNKRMGAVKLLGTGTFTKKVSVEGCILSGSAQEKLTNAGSTVQGR